MDRAHWLRGGYGLMYHYLVPHLWDRDGRQVPADPEAAARRFDMEAFLRDFDAVGAQWFVFTLGQNTGFYASPNAVLTRYAGPGHCSGRDLALELAQALRARGKRFIAYLPSEIRANASLHDGFAWNDANAPRQVEFQRRWCEVIAEWSVRLGGLLDGWWFDGCYAWDGFLQPYMEWDLWYAAARAGNAAVAVTFNDGCFNIGSLRPIRPDFDYFAGEASFLRHGMVPNNNRQDDLYLPTDEYMDGTRCRTHVLVPIDCLWAHNGFTAEQASAAYLRESPYTVLPPDKLGEMEPPYCPDDELASFLKTWGNAGAGVTLNVGCFVDGTMGNDTRAQLLRIARGVK